ncbi:MAG: hypothetical protein ACXVA0_24035 [Mucilaginibacter sp.]
MNLETIDSRLREKLDPHVSALVDGSSTEYDIFPAVLSTILNKQLSLINNQTNLANLVDSQLEELKVSRDSNQEALIEINNSINELRAIQNNINDVKFGDLKLQQDTSFQEVSNALTGLNELISGILKQQNSLEGSLLVAQEERLSIRKISISNLILSIISVALLIGILFVLLK